MTLPDFSFEQKLWQKNLPAGRQGYKFIAGVDEVGRGCFAGPIVAGCVVLDQNTIHDVQGTTLYGGSKIIINDSKKLTPKQRELADKWIREYALGFGIGQASVAQINRLGIKKATEIAFRKAIDNATKRLRYSILDTGKNKSSQVSKYPSIEYLLIDAFYIPYVKGLPVGKRKKPACRQARQKAIVKGDTLSISIAAASIIAKVYRDELMTSLSRQSKYKNYKWGKNKGYGTKEHQNAIKKYGITRQHRKKWIETWSSSFFSSQAR